MDTFLLHNNNFEKIDFRANENTFAFVHTLKKKPGLSAVDKTIIFDRITAIKLLEILKERLNV